MWNTFLELLGEDLVKNEGGGVVEYLFIDKFKTLRFERKYIFTPPKNGSSLALNGAALVCYE